MVKLKLFSNRKDVIKLIRECIVNRRDFTVETKLAGGNVIRQMREAKANDLRVRRHLTSLENLIEHLDLIDHWIVIDNSSTEGEIVLEVDRATIRYYEKLLPERVTPLERGTVHN